MAHSVRFRISRADAKDWQEAFQAALRASPELANAEVSRPIPPSGAAAIDPTVAVALIGAGAQVLAAAITAFVTLWSTRQSANGKPAEPQSFVIVLNGTRDSLTLPPAAVAESTRLRRLIEDSADQIGPVREVSIEPP